MVITHQSSPPQASISIDKRQQGSHQSCQTKPKPVWFSFIVTRTKHTITDNTAYRYQALSFHYFSTVVVCRTPTTHPTLRSFNMHPGPPQLLISKCCSLVELSTTANYIHYYLHARPSNMVHKFPLLLMHECHFHCCHCH